MRLKNQKGRVMKKMLDKVEGVCRTWDYVQAKAAEMLSASDDVEEIQVNVLLDLEIGGKVYTTDFLIRKSDGDLMVRECVYRKNLLRPSTIKLLDASRNYWLGRGVKDWGVVIDKEEVH